ncbi:MAG TPA: DUF72 domain-containing protein [Alloacidobacterium sp.]|nr:DUF72 domain-containing protein [Alloacidobacterium sp.]
MTSSSQISHPSLPGSIYVGCSGWAYSSWKPDFYPKSVPAKKFLEYYATQLNSVEVNYTFRSLPSAAITDSWLSAIPSGFRFSFKAPQRITHILRLKNCAEAIARFAEAIAPVVKADRFGTVLFQLPPNFKADSERLAAFLADASSTKLKLAFEFRHESWFSDEIYSILRRYNTALCVAESDELQTPDIATADFACYRLRRSDYSEKQLDTVCEQLRGKSASGDVFAYFKHEEEPTGPLRAAAVLQRLRSA